MFFPRTERSAEAANPYVLDPIDPTDPHYRTLGAANRDLYSWTLKKSQDLSVHLYRSNPLANRLIRIYRSFCAGEGFSIEAAHPEVQAVLDEAWTSPRSELEDHHSDYARDWLIFGESPVAVAADEVGNTTVGWIDPSTITSVERDERNNVLLRAIHVKRGMGIESIRVPIVGMDTDPSSDSAGMLIGDVFFWCFERISGTTRGMPFLLPIIDWLDLYDSNLWEMAERQKAMRAHLWDVEVVGDSTEAEKLEKKWGTSAPRSGTTRFHNDKVKVGAISPQLGHYEDVSTARFLLRHIATGGSVAPHWLSDPEDANRSTAEQMDIPILRSLVDVQSAWQRNMTRLAQYVVDRKVEAGTLPRLAERMKSDMETPVSEDNPEPTRDLVVVNVPEIEGEKVADAATMLLSLAQAFMTLDTIDLAGRETMRKIVRSVLPALGVPADELPDDDPEDTEASDRNLDDFVEAAARGGL